jgi:hypothetical protein
MLAVLLDGPPVRAAGRGDFCSRSCSGRFRSTARAQRPSPSPLSGWKSRIMRFLVSSDRGSPEVRANSPKTARTKEIPSDDHRPSARPRATTTDGETSSARPAAGSRRSVPGSCCCFREAGNRRRLPGASAAPMPCLPHALPLRGSRGVPLRERCLKLFLVRCGLFRRRGYRPRRRAGLLARVQGLSDLTSRALSPGTAEDLPTCAADPDSGSSTVRTGSVPYTERGSGD